MENVTSSVHIWGTTETPCVDYGMGKFPGTFMTQRQRFFGGIAVHCLIILYLSSTAALVSEYLCVPSLQLAIRYMGIPPDVGGAIVMPLATSSAELVSCIVGSFVVDNNVGIWTVIGTSAFNLLGFTSLNLLFSLKNTISLDSYRITRDCLLNILTLSLVVWILYDGIVRWWEAVVLTVCLLFYVLLLIFDRKLEIIVKNQIGNPRLSVNGEATTNEVDHVKIEIFIRNFGRSTLATDYPVLFQEQSISVSCTPFFKINSLGFNAHSLSLVRDSLEQQMWKLKNEDKGRLFSGWRIIMYPAIYCISVIASGCTKYKQYKLFTSSYVLSLIILGGISYVSLWMVTVIGYTYKIPMAVVGVVLFAVGSSIPQIAFGAFGIRKMSGERILSNPLENNLFGILLCLGVPWSVKCLWVEADGKITVDNYAIFLSLVLLLAVVSALLIIVCVLRWKIRRKLALVFLLIYAVFIASTVLLQTDVIGHFRPPPCKR
ncbi:sodium/potassium/calcium exchanger 5-like isoform X1 [Centruroides vittatus]|uniref:sodium/potassium/calcium exchanger 5-like isoform X1 n=1 Tax=Centruroides vittatus TaxID=120091 RepID=UPI0035106FD8